MSYLVAADAVLLLHVLFVVFVVVGLVLILAGKLLSWAWVQNWWFRVMHLAAIGIVVLQSWIGVICPLTKLEMYLRGKAGDVHCPSFVFYYPNTQNGKGVASWKTIWTIRRSCSDVSRAASGIAASVARTTSPHC